MQRSGVTRSFPGRGALVAVVGAALVGIVWGGGARPAQAEPFSNGDLFLGRAMKTTRAARFVDGGLRFEVAPVRAASAVAVAQYRADHPEVEPVFALLRQVDPAILETADGDTLRQTLLALPGLSDDDRRAIVRVFPEGAAGETASARQTVAAVNELGPILTETAVSFSLAPFVAFNFEAVQVTLDVPMAGVIRTDGTAFCLGNLSLDARFAHYLGAPYPFGIGYGVQVAFPTGGSESDALGVANRLNALRFFHQYLSFAPYVTAGLDLPFVSFQAHLDVVEMLAVRGAADDKVSVVLRYGFAVVLDLFGIVALNAELGGAADLKNAERFAGLFLAGGLRFNALGFKLGAAVQFPLALSDDRSYGSYGGIDFGSPADINVMVTLGYQY